MKSPTGTTVDDTDWFGLQKGAEVLIIKRGLWVPDMLGQHKIKPELCMQTVLSKCLDFLAEKPIVQTIIESYGLCALWLPTYHSVCNAPEYFWGNGEKRYSIHCDYTMKHLKANGMRILFNIDPYTALNFIRKERDHGRQLRGGANGMKLQSHG